MPIGDECAGVFRDRRDRTRIEIDFEPHEVKRRTVEAIKNSQTVIVFDHVDHVADDSWIDRIEDAPIVVISRKPMVGIPQVVMTRLSKDAARKMFHHNVRKFRGQMFDERSKTSVDQIIEILSGWPIAIRLAAMRTRIMGPEALLQSLADVRILKEKGGANLVELLEQTFSDTDDMTRAWLARFSVFPETFSIDDVAVAFDVPFVDVADEIDRLLADGWLESSISSNDSVQFKMLGVVAGWARQRLDAEQREAAIRKIGALYIQQLQELDALHGSIRDVSTLWSRAKRFVDQFSKTDPALCTDLYLEFGSITLLFDPADEGIRRVESLMTESDRLTVESYGSLLILRAKMALRRRELDAANTYATEAKMLEIDSVAFVTEVDLIHATTSMHVDTEYSEKTIKAAIEKLDSGEIDFELQAVICMRYGMILGSQFRLEEADKWFERAYRVASEASSELTQIEVGNAWGYNAFRAARFDDARTRFEQALQRSIAVGARPRELASRFNLAFACQYLGLEEKAFRELEIARDVALESGATDHLPPILVRMSWILLEQGKTADAEQWLEEARRRSVALEDRYNEACSMVLLSFTRSGDDRITLIESALRSLNPGFDPIICGIALRSLSKFHPAEEERSDAARRLDALIEAIDPADASILRSLVQLKNGGRDAVGCRLFETAETRGPVLKVHSEAYWFETGDGQRVDLTTRRPLRLLLKNSLSKLITPVRRRCKV